MKTYETPIGTATITSGRMLVKGQWGVMAKVGSREIFITFTGKPELEAAFPQPEYMSIESGEIEEGYYVKNGRLVRKQADMDREDSIK